MTWSQIRDAERALESWASERHGTALAGALFLLNRLAQEAECRCGSGGGHPGPPQGDAGRPDRHYHLRPYVLNKVLDCWRVCYREGRTDVEPAEMIALVDDLESRGVVTPDSRSLTLIVDGICLGITRGGGGRRQRRGQHGEDGRDDDRRFEAPLLAQWLLDRRMEQAHEDETLMPDTVLLSNVIRAWAKSGRMEAPEMAEGILEMMHDLHRDGWTQSGPNTLSYGVTMEAWYSSRHPDACHRIDALLQEMKDSPLEHVVPDRIAYQYALNGWADSRSSTGADRADQILQEMVALYEGGSRLVAPDVSHFSRAMAALARRGDATRVEALLEQLQDLHAASGGDRSFRPNGDCWRACILAKAKTGAAEEAQGMLDELVERAMSARDWELMPRRSYFVDVLVAWTKHKDQGLAAEQSQRVLDRLVQLGNGGFRDLLPDAKSFDRVILAWSRTRRPDAPERIESLLEQMERMYTLGNYGMRASIDGYTNLMLAWLRSGREESSDSVQRIYETLRDRCGNGGERHLCPDKFVFGILIDSWARRGDVARAEATFEEMMDAWSRGGNPKAAPDTRVIHRMLEAWSGERTPEAVGRCEHYMRLMKDGGTPVPFMAHAHLMDALSGSAAPVMQERACAALEDIVQDVATGAIPRPGVKEYRQFLQLVANSSIPRRNQQAREVLRSMPRGQVPEKLLP